MVSFNAEWFFRPDNAFIEQFGLELASLEVKTARVARRIADLYPPPHVVALQEIEDQAVLDGLIAVLSREHDMKYAGVVGAHASLRTGQRVAFLYDQTCVDVTEHGSVLYARDGEQIAPFLKNTPHAVTDELMQKNVWMHVRYQGVPFTLLNLHLKACMDQESIAIRRQESLVVQGALKWLQHRFKGHLICLGDFNDCDGDFPAASVPKQFTGVVKRIKQGADLGKNSKYEAVLLTPATQVHRKKRFSIIYRELIDHILSDRPAESFQIMHEIDTPPEVKDRASDHFPIVAVYKV